MSILETNIHQINSYELKQTLFLLHQKLLATIESRWERPSWQKSHYPTQKTIFIEKERYRW